MVNLDFREHCLRGGHVGRRSKSDKIGLRVGGVDIIGQNIADVWGTGQASDLDESKPIITERLRWRELASSKD